MDEGLPATALEKIDVATTAVNKLIKSLSNTVQSMKAFMSNSLCKQSYDKLCIHVSHLRSMSMNLENIRTIGQLPDNTPADCRTVHINSVP